MVKCCMKFYLFCLTFWCVYSANADKLFEKITYIIIISTSYMLSRLFGAKPLFIYPHAALLFQ